MSAAFQRDTVVFMFDVRDRRWAERPVLDFVRSPSGGGRYTTHPDSPLPGKLGHSYGIVT